MFLQNFLGIAPPYPILVQNVNIWEESKYHDFFVEGQSK